MKDIECAVSTPNKVEWQEGDCSRRLFENWRRQWLRRVFRHCDQLNVYRYKPIYVITHVDIWLLPPASPVRVARPSSSTTLTGCSRSGVRKGTRVPPLSASLSWRCGTRIVRRTAPSRRAGRRGRRGSRPAGRRSGGRAVRLAGAAPRRRPSAAPSAWGIESWHEAGGATFVIISMSLPSCGREGTSRREPDVMKWCYDAMLKNIAPSRFWASHCNIATSLHRHRVWLGTRWSFSTIVGQWSSDLLWEDTSPHPSPLTPHPSPLLPASPPVSTPPMPPPPQSPPPVPWAVPSARVHPSSSAGRGCTRWSREAARGRCPAPRGRPAGRATHGPGWSARGPGSLQTEAAVSHWSVTGQSLASHRSVACQSHAQFVEHLNKIKVL